MQYDARTPKEYLDALPPEHKSMVSALRRAIKSKLPKGYKEGMQYGMITYSVPLTTYKNGYLDNPKVPLPYISLGAQKHHVAVYHNGLYASKQRLAVFTKAYEKTGKRLSMGKSCIRFKKLDDIPLAVISESAAACSVHDYITLYEKARRTRAVRR